MKVPGPVNERVDSQYEIRSEIKSNPGWLYPQYAQIMVYLAAVVDIVFEEMQEYPVPRDHVVTAKFAHIVLAL